MKEIKKSISFPPKNNLEELKALVEKQDTRIWKLATDLEDALDLMKMLLEQDVITPDVRELAFKIIAKSKEVLKNENSRN